MFDLQGKKALITGATGAIGHAIAVAFIEAGAQVVLSGTRVEKLEQLKIEFGDKAQILACNLSDSTAVKNLFADAEKLLGQIDILVCNAGITKDNLMMRMSDEEFDEVISVNLKSSWILNREAIKAMMRRRYGRIINISSVVGQTGNMGQSNYAASKAGLIGMSKSAAQEGASRGITVNCIAPGFIESPMTDVIREDMKEKIKAKIPMNVIGEPNDIAAGALYLASNEAKYITGQVLGINGGMYM